MKKYILLIMIVLLFSGCSGVNFMGASKWVGGGLYVERWYLNPEYDKKDIPSGTAFYGAAAEKIKNKFTVKYYIQDGKDQTVEIPLKDMWTTKHNGKEDTEQDDDDLFIYAKIDNRYIKGGALDHIELAIQECYEDGWCKLYDGYSYMKKRIETNLYVRKSILNKPLTEEPVDSKNSNRKIPAFPNIAKPASHPWVSPTKEICEANNGMFSNKNVCQSTYQDAQNMCKTLDATLPLIEQLEQVYLDCASNEMKANEYDPLKYKYIECINNKGFSLDINVKDAIHRSYYWSSTKTPPEYSRYDGSLYPPAVKSFQFTQNKKSDVTNGLLLCKECTDKTPRYNKLAVMCRAK